MKLKPLLVAVVILAALALAAYLLQRPPAAAPADARVGRPVLDPAAVERATRIELTDQGRRVAIARQGAAWVVSSYYDLPADLAKLSQFIDDLSRATVQRFVTRDPGRLARLEFKDTAITLSDAAGRPAWKLALGRDADSGGRFIRFDDEPQAYLANLAVFLDTEPKNWADSQLVNLKPDDVAAVEVTFADGSSFGASRAGKDAPWVPAKTPAGLRLKGDRITALLSSFTNLRFQDTADPKSPDVEAARRHDRTVRLTTFAHQTLTIDLGRRPAPPAPPAAPAPEVQRTETPGPANRGRQPAKAEPAPVASRATAAQPSTQNPEPKTQNRTSPPAPPAAPPAGPVYASVTNSDPAAPVNAVMKRRAFQIYDWVFNDLPKTPGEFFEPVPPAPPPAKPAAPAEKPAPAAAAPPTKP